MKVTLVGFEGEYAVCELPQYRKVKKIKRSLIPPEAKEGDVLTVIGDYITVNVEETLKRKSVNQQL